MPGGIGLAELDELLAPLLLLRGPDRRLDRLLQPREGPGGACGRALVEALAPLRALA